MGAYTRTSNKVAAFLFFLLVEVASCFLLQPAQTRSCIFVASMSHVGRVPSYGGVRVRKLLESRTALEGSKIIQCTPASATTGRSIFKADTTVIGDISKTIHRWGLVLFRARHVCGIGRNKRRFLIDCDPHCLAPTLLPHNPRDKAFSGFEVCCGLPSFATFSTNS